MFMAVAYLTITWNCCNQARKKELERQNLENYDGK